MIGPYSKKFSGASNHLLSQPNIVMDECSNFESIYFCGVLKAGYLNRNPLKNNYPHNVHFIVKPVDGNHDVWDFENWHVEIDGGVLERIPAIYELNNRFFTPPYGPHFYTCRIFRWMVGHFYPNELVDIKHGYPETLEVDGKTFNTETIIKELIESGYKFAEACYTLNKTDESKSYFADFKKSHHDDCRRYTTLSRVRDYIAMQKLFDRKTFTENITNLWLESIERLDLTKFACLKDVVISSDDMIRFSLLGVEEYLDMLDQNQCRKVISGWSKQ